MLISCVLMNTCISLAVRPPGVIKVTKKVKSQLWPKNMKNIKKLVMLVSFYRKEELLPSLWKIRPLGETFA
jgi:hypothetical protein